MFNNDLRHQTDDQSQTTPPRLAMYQQVPPRVNPAQIDPGKFSTLSQVIKIEMQQRRTKHQLRK